MEDSGKILSCLIANHMFVWKKKRHLDSTIVKVLKLIKKLSIKLNAGVMASVIE